MIQLDGINLDVLSTDPSSPDDGSVWFNTTQGLLKARIAGVTRAVGTFIGLGIDDSSLADDYILRYDTASQKWIAEELGSSPTVADVQQLAINEKEISLGSSWQSFGSFIFGGTGNWGAVNQILVLTAMSRTSGRTHSVRVYDVTNGNTIAEATGLVHGSATIADLGTVSNLPIGQAIWEVQARRTGATFKLDFYTISMKETVS